MVRGAGGVIWAICAPAKSAAHFENAGRWSTGIGAALALLLSLVTLIPAAAVIALLQIVTCLTSEPAAA